VWIHWIAAEEIVMNDGSRDVGREPHLALIARNLDALTGEAQVARTNPIPLLMQ
jgi:hypothetical protein